MLETAEWKSIYFTLTYPKMPYYPLQTKISFETKENDSSSSRRRTVRIFAIKVNTSGVLERHHRSNKTRLGNDACWIDLEQSDKLTTSWHHFYPDKTETDEEEADEDDEKEKASRKKIPVDAEWIRFSGVNPTKVTYKSDRPSVVTVASTEGGTSRGRPAQRFLLCRRRGLYRIDYRMLADRGEVVCFEYTDHNGKHDKILFSTTPTLFLQDQQTKYTIPERFVFPLPSNLPEEQKQSVSAVVVMVEKHKKQKVVRAKIVSPPVPALLPSPAPPPSHIIVMYPFPSTPPPVSVPFIYAPQPIHPHPQVGWNWNWNWNPYSMYAGTELPIPRLFQGSSPPSSPLPSISPPLPISPHRLPSPQSPSSAKTNSPLSEDFFV